MMLYSKQVLQHFENPQHVGELPLHANVVVAETFAGEDKVKCFVVIENESVADIRYQVYGCPAMIACMSWLSGEMLNKSREDLQKISAMQIAHALELPAHKHHCAVLAETVLKKIVSKREN